MKKYNPATIEKKWQKKWYSSTIFKAQDGSKKKKTYLLVEFPYPSGDGLHVGHCRSYTALDIIARKRRMQGENVLYPMGWDAFGLPAENYAIKKGIHPSITTKKSIATFKKQMQSLGFSFDWSREINTTDPAYYKWTQWIFIKLFEKGLAYKEKMAINWCPKDKIGLANEEVINGKCERCGTAVEKREKEQWLIKITKYADRLAQDLDLVDYLERIKTQQREWIGKSEGMLFTAPVKGMDLKIQTFSAHFEAFAADTFVVIAPDHPLLQTLIKGVKNEEEIKSFCKKVIAERLANREEKEVEGIFTGRYIIDPVGNGDLPIWVANFALADYGTGIVKCSAHDERDFRFAKKYNLKLKPVLFPEDPVLAEKVKNLEVCYTDMNNGILSEPKEFTGKKGGQVKQDIITYLEKNNLAVRKTTYKLRDWIFSRQHYWGEPIPMIFCQSCHNKHAAVLPDINETVIPNIIDKRNPPRPDKKFVTRRNVHAIVRDPKTNKYLALKWKQFNWVTFPMGGVNRGEDLVDAAKREVQEETGYTNLKLVRVIEGTVRAEYFAAHKDENRIAFTNAVVFDLMGQEKVAVDAEEKEKYEIIWLDRDQLNYKVMTHAEVEEWGKRLDNPHYVYQGKNVFIISKHAGWFPVPDSELPVELPKVKKYEPTDTGESPLAVMEKWVKVKCPNCGGPAKRETDTMPNWAGSNWYFMRYTDPKNSKRLADEKKLNYFMPVDWYNGGMEHTTLHLLYSRFIYKFLWDIGAVPKQIGPEPYRRRTSHGIILGPGGVKMSKSRGNVINPDDVIKQYGADTLRTYEMFMGPFDQMIPWDEKGIIGVRRFLEKVHNLAQKNVGKKGDETLAVLLNKTIKKVSEDIEAMKFNTAVSSMMEFANAWHNSPLGIDKKHLQMFLAILSPFAPHLVQELWMTTGFKGQVGQQSWPKHNEKLVKEEKVLLIVQINGKVRDKIEIPIGLSEEKTKEVTLASTKVKEWLKEGQPKKIIFVPNKLINIVV